MHKNPPISFLIILVVLGVPLTASTGCNGGGPEGAGGSGGAVGGSAGATAGSGGSTLGGSGGGLGSGGGPGSGGSPGGSGGANDASAADAGGIGSGGADGSAAGGDAGTDAAAGDGGMLSACPANPMRTDPPLTPAAFCQALLTPCKPHTQPPYKADCEAAYMKAKSQSCQSYNLCFGVVGMKMLIPYCSRAQGLGPVGNCS